MQAARSRVKVEFQEYEGHRVSHILTKVYGPAFYRAYGNKQLVQPFHARSAIEVRHKDSYIVRILYIA
jgi:hypothetical protein